jgi:(2Fe-2S) ferredoxin
MGVLTEDGEMAVADDAGDASSGPAPFYTAHVFVCCNRRPDGHARGSCAAKGSERLRDYMKVRGKELGLKRVRVNMAGCLDRCELGPCMVIYPEGVWYRVGSTEDVDAILERHLIAGERVARLELPQRARIEDENGT